MLKWKSQSAVVAMVAVIAFAAGRAAPIGGSAAAAQPPGDKKPAAAQPDKKDSKPDKKDAQPAKKEGKPGGPPEPTPEQIKRMSPGPEHKILEGMVGDWEGEVSMWMEPGGEAMKQKGSAHREMSFDGRYLMKHVKGIPEGEHGFKGMGITGYNAMDKRYEAVWIDNQSTVIVFATGAYDAAKKTLSTTSEFSDAMTGKKSKHRDTIDLSDLGISASG